MGRPRRAVFGVLVDDGLERLDVPLVAPALPTTFKYVFGTEQDQTFLFKYVFQVKIRISRNLATLAAS